MQDKDVATSTLCFVGDLSPSCIYSQHVETLSRSLAEIRSAIPESATLFFNLECSLFEGQSGRDTEANEAALRTLEALKPAVANLSNNHHFDSGNSGSSKVRQILDDVGIPYVGLYSQGERGYDIVEVDMKRVGIICRTVKGANPKSWGENASMMLQFERSEILSTYDLLVDQVDITITCLHWGAEYYRRPSPRQQRFVEELVARGVDVVWGHHAHVLQPRLLLENSLVIYGMGNCIFGQTTEGRWPIESQQSAMLVFEIGGNGQKCWEIAYDAGNSGTPLSCKQASVIQSQNGQRLHWYPISVVVWACYRFYMELVVFGVRFIQRKFKKRRNPSGTSGSVNSTIASFQSTPRVSKVIRERFRRVVMIWEDE